MKKGIQQEAEVMASSNKDLKTCQRCGKQCRIRRTENLCKPCQRSDSRCLVSEVSKPLLLEMLGRVESVIKRRGYDRRLYSLRGGLASLHGNHPRIRQERWDHWSAEYYDLLQDEAQSSSDERSCVDASSPESKSDSLPAATSKLENIYGEIEAMGRDSA